MTAPATKVLVIRKKSKRHAHHGGAWKVAYADFVTAMMALFIVLWLLTQTDAKTKEVISEYFRTGELPGGSLVIGDPGGSEPPVPIRVLSEGGTSGVGPSKAGGIDQLAASVRALLTRAAEDPALAALARSVRVDVGDEGALIELVDSGEELLFSVASSELKPATVRFLQELAPLLEEGTHDIQIHGHTDARRYDKDSRKSNWDLSFSRADHARRVLEAAGVPRGRIRGVLAHADTELYLPSDPYAPQNRRLSVLVQRSHEAAPSAPSSP